MLVVVIYNGGMITVVTRSGSDNFHGRAFDFFRNTALDSRGYFDPTKSAFRQHQFGGALGGPLARTGIYFFDDYQGTRTTQGIPTGRITVLSSAERKGDFSSSSSTLSGCVNGPYLASLLSRRTGHAVNEGDPYSERSTNCNPGSSPVFPSGLIPQNAWSAPAQHLIQYIPSPNVDVNQFSSSSFNQTVRDDKGSWRLDRSTPVGQLSAYYFLDDYRLNNPYPGRQGGATITGKSFLLILQGSRKEVNETVFAEVTYHASYEPKRSARTTRWKYIRHFDDRRNVVLPNCDDGYSKTFWMKNGWKSLPSVSHEELYDLVFDPNEQNNLAGSQQQIAQAALQDLRSQLNHWMKQTKDPLLNGPVPLVKGGHIVPQDGDSPKGLGGYIPSTLK